MAKVFIANFLRKHADASPRLLRLLWAVEGGFIGTLRWLSSRLSPDRASAVGCKLLRLLGPRLDKTRIIRRNLQIAFPDKRAAEIEQLVRGVWGTMGSILAEYAHLETICHHEAASRLEIIHRGNLDVLEKDGRPAVFIAGHLANWEVAPCAAVWKGIPVTVIYTPIQNPLLDRMLYQLRESVNCEIVKRDGSMRHLVRALKKGVSVGLIVDQRADNGEAVPFFGHDTNTSITPAQLALRFGCPLIPVQVQRLEGARFRIIFHEPVQPDPSAMDEHEKVLQMTRKIRALFESWIRERPHEWVCSKRRWPKRPD